MYHAKSTLSHNNLFCVTQFSEGRQSVHDEDGSHTARRTAAVLTEFGWKLFDQSPTALIFLPASFTFSCTSRNSCPPVSVLATTKSLRRPSQAGSIHRRQSTKPRTVIQKLIPRFDKCLNSGGGYVEK
ncbi:hypothetical protein TNCV_2904151 [Trichonephila clavipes]|nr:hypothetical protein TNCV_2904151 [Trichonephila clavipes]